MIFFRVTAAFCSNRWKEKKKELEPEKIDTNASTTIYYIL